jgi:serine/threonine-protein kinase RsbW
MRPGKIGGISMSPGHLAHVSATSHGVRQVVDALDGFCSAERLPEDVVWRLRVALDEVLANVVSHGAHGAVPADIEVQFRRDGDVVEITIADNGAAFNPLWASAPDITTPLDQRQPGGVGILLVKNLVDEVLYTYTTQNVVTLRKRL